MHPPKILKTGHRGNDQLCSQASVGPYHPSRAGSGPDMWLCCGSAVTVVVVVVVVEARIGMRWMAQCLQEFTTDSDERQNLR